MPQDHEQVSRWVNGHRLPYRRNDGRAAGSRLVHERVPNRRVPLQQRSTPRVLFLADTLDIKGGRFADYLRDQLTRRADYRCVESIEQSQTRTARSLARACPPNQATQQRPSNEPKLVRQARP